MKFQVVNSVGENVFCTYFLSCWPSDSQLSSMAEAGYKFKIDGKVVSKKKIKEIRDGEQ